MTAWRPPIKDDREWSTCLRTVSGLSSRSSLVEAALRRHSIRRNQRSPGPPANNHYTVTQDEHEPEFSSLGSAASDEGLQAHYVFDCLLIKARKDVRWNDLVVEVLVQSIQGDKILIQRLIFQLGGHLAKEVKELPVACNHDVVRRSERLELLRNCTPKELGRFSILARRDCKFAIRAILIAGLIEPLKVLTFIR